MKRFALVNLTILLLLSPCGFGDLVSKLYGGANGGDWYAGSNWAPEGAPTVDHAVYISNLTVRVATEATAGALELVGGSLIVAGAGTAVRVQTPLDPERTDPVGLTVVGDALLAGDVSIGGLNHLRVASSR